MKLKREEIAKIAFLIQQHLKEGQHIANAAPEDRVRERIDAIITKNLQEEVAIEDETKRLMEQYRAQIASGAIDSQKAYMMIKKQVAKDRKFIL